MCWHGILDNNEMDNKNTDDFHSKTDTFYVSIALRRANFS